MDPRIGTELAGHRIEAVIGRGGASVVFLAEHVRLGRKVALKVLAPHLADDEAFRERFIRESRLAAALDHPNIVTIYDAGDAEDVLYISMRYIEGSDLGKVLRAEGALEPSRAIRILSQVAEALDAAHGKGLVHRDVKPGNVLLEISDTGLERAYLADFGISKRTTSGSGLTRTGQFVGTVDYVAPEQISGASVDARTDVYSLGCVLFQCLTGEVPFHGDTDVATIYRQLHDPPPTYDAVGGSTGMDDVFARALSKTKEARYPTCVGLIGDARAALADTRVSPAVARRMAPATAEGDEGDEGDDHDRAHRRSRPIWFGVVGVGVAAVVAAAILAWPPGDATGPTASTETGSTTSDTGGSSPPERFTDPTWTRSRDRAKFGDQSMNDVLVTDDGLVAVGHVQPFGGDEEGAVWLSTDVDHWRPSGSETLGGPGDQRLLSVVASGRVLVAGGWMEDGTGTHQGAVWISRDGGTSWDPPSVIGETAEVRGLALLGSTLVAVGDVGPEGYEDAAVWTSSDGENWTPSQDLDLRPEGDQEVWSVHAAAALLVAVGSSEGVDGTFDAAVWTSTDGTEWDRVDPGMFEEAGNQLMKAAAGGVRGHPFVVVGCEDDEFVCDSEGHDSDAAVWISDDGADWSKVSLDGDGLVGEGIQTMVDVARERDHFVAVGRVTANPGDLDGADWISADGLEWELQLTPVFKVAALGGEGDQAIRSVTPYHRGLRFVAVGVTSALDQDAVVWSGS